MRVVTSRRKGTFGFVGPLLPFFALVALGSWGLSQFRKLPTQLKDERKRERREGRERFNLDREQERLQ